eukprot:TRINITY_DN3067_c0_g4_i1.p2 TRINITY_DN3067_c0_g4~~TRINITY_DN3067_c0_g4_i1.p2  ORF type:complete len:105 (+),score=9.83 TRINITY_DN3067_c0_g4_i1:523-837(+)
MFATRKWQGQRGGGEDVGVDRSAREMWLAPHHTKALAGTCFHRWSCAGTGKIVVRLVPVEEHSRSPVPEGQPGQRRGEPRGPILVLHLLLVLPANPTSAPLSSV